MLRALRIIRNTRIPRKLRLPKNAVRFLLFLALYFLVKLLIENHSFWVAIILSCFYAVSEIAIDSSSKLLAVLYVNKIMVILVVNIICMGLYLFAYPRYTYNVLKPTVNNYPELVKNILGFVLQGAVLGLITRMLLVHYFALSIKGKDVFYTKILMMIVYLVLLIVFPFTHREYIPSYSLGFGLGFLIHYIARKPEKRNALYARLSQNLLAMIETMKKGEYKLNTNEERAIQLYASQKWTTLKAYLEEIKENEIIFFIKLSMFRKLHQYDIALNLVHEKETNAPEWFKENKHFFHLHFSLNKYEKSVQLHEKAQIIQNLQDAIIHTPHCLLSNATLALMIANDIDISDENDESMDQKKKALDLIWNAMKIYEIRDKNPKIISLITGMTIPFTYSFLLDTYGYVLFKNGYLKFSKALFMQCLAQDPSFSPTYIHLAEWYIEYSKRVKSKGEVLLRAAKLNLHIAIQNERLDDIENNGSYIIKKAKTILQTL